MSPLSLTLNSKVDMPFNLTILGPAESPDAPADSATSGKDIHVEWKIADYTTGMTAYVGDTVVFAWRGGAGAHNVFVHPSGDCARDGAYEVGAASPASYTFAEAGTITFACDVYGGAHCYAGQILTFEVTEAPANSPAGAPARFSADEAT